MQKLSNENKRAIEANRLYGTTDEQNIKLSHNAINASDLLATYLS